MNTRIPARQGLRNPIEHCDGARRESVLLGFISAKVDYQRVGAAPMRVKVDAKNVFTLIARE